MKITEQQKRNIEFIEKLLLIITFIVGIIVSTYKGYEFLSAKTSEVTTNKKRSEVLIKEVEKRIELADSMGNFYISQIESINKDIANLDQQVEKEPWADSLKGTNLMAIRDKKVKDRQQLLDMLGKQIIELKKLEK